MKHQNERGEKYFSKTTLNPTQAASMFAPPKMPGSTMGKSVLLMDESSSSQRPSPFGSSGLTNRSSNPYNQANSDENTVINMDLMQKQQMQKNLIVNQEVRLLIIIRIRYYSIYFFLFNCVFRRHSCENVRPPCRRSSRRSSSWAACFSSWRP